MFLVYLILHRYYASRGFATVSPKKRRWLEFASIWFQIISLAISSFLVYIAFGPRDFERHQYAFLAINIGNLIIIPLIMIHSAYYWFKGKYLWCYLGAYLFRNETLLIHIYRWWKITLETRTNSKPRNARSRSCCKYKSYNWNYLDCG